LRTKTGVTAGAVAVQESQLEGKISIDAIFNNSKNEISIGYIF